MRIIIIGGVLLTFIMLISQTAIEKSQTTYQDLKKEAERYFESGSYALAHSLYTKINKKELSSTQARWVDFRQADTLWRSEAATNSADTTKLDQARQQLEMLIRDIQRVEDRDRVWVEVQESLGDFWWSRRNSRNWSQAWIYYQAALDWWAGSSDLDLARTRYLKIVWTLSKPPEVEPYYYYGYYG
ncbi:MAG TPA: hypothetical protein VMW38_21090, partial [Terriglobia bacterium]|nr:hypothetical protein [Terriglobia bacterium]